jgi:ribosomal protein S18 acetylase RimI-like enzyme
VHEHTFEDFLHGLNTDERFDPSLFLLACEGEKIVGLVLGLKGTPEDPETLYVDDVAVLRPWRRRGIAQALLLALLGEAYRRGMRRATLEADADNETGAIRVYEKAGMHVWREALAFGKQIPRADG